MPAPHALYSKMLAERTASRNVLVLFYFIYFTRAARGHSVYMESCIRNIQMAHNENDHMYGSRKRAQYEGGATTLFTSRACGSSNINSIRTAVHESGSVYCIAGRPVSKRLGAPIRS
jgi:hypothetical protein